MKLANHRVIVRTVELITWPSLCWYEWFMVGNSCTPDIMAMTRRKSYRSDLGSGFLLLPEGYLDLHCRAIGLASVFLNFHYEAWP